MSTKNILVPTDFSEVAHNAVAHAIKTAAKTGGSVHLLHVVEKKDMVEKSKVKLQEEEAKAKAINASVPIHSIVRVGNIFDDIGDVASEIDAELIFMGTHGMRGMQFITGSHAMKVITNSKPPFIVVQKKAIKDEGYDDIVVPLDLSKETKQKLTTAANMARYFKSRIHIITPNESDEYFVKRLNANLNFAKQFFKEKGIEFTTTIAESNASAFVKEIMSFAASKDADLIAIMNLQENSLFGILGPSYEQQMITNEAQIPVMVINPLQNTVSGGVFSS
jgi:nucleotide-binding universal stress UspA family protein